MKIDKKYEALFTPWKVGNVEIKNRIVMCPMGGTSLFGWFELGGCHFDKEAAALFLERALEAILEIVEYTSSTENDLTANGSSKQSTSVEPFKWKAQQLFGVTNNIEDFEPFCV